jgi:hypothetical protein
MILGYYSVTVYSTFPFTYSVYTFIYGLLTLFFNYFVWIGKRFGWIGTVAVSLFIIVVDSIAVFDIANFLGIPSPLVAAIGEIPFSLLIFVYLMQKHVMSKYNI